MEKPDYYIEMIENFYRSIENDPNEYLLDNEKNHKRWVLYRGSIVTYIYLNLGEEKSTLRIFAPLVYLPQTNILPLYRECLEYNFSLVNCSLCVLSDTIGLVVERPLEGLDPIELTGMISYLTAVADDLDNKLAEKFGALIVTEHNQ